MFNPTQSIYSGINLNHSNLSLRTHSYCSKNTLTLIAVIFAVGALIVLTIGGLILSPSGIGIVGSISGGVTGGLSILFFIMAVKKHLKERRHQNQPPERNNLLLQSEIEAPANQQPPPQSTDELHPPVSSRTDPQLSPTNSPQRSDPLHGRDISTLFLNEIESILATHWDTLSESIIERLLARQEFLENSMRERTRQNAPQPTQIDRQNEFGTEPFIIVDGLFDFFPFDIISEILYLENKRIDYIQRLNNNPQIFPALSQETEPTYDNRYDREIWENYEIYNMETFRWEPLQVLNKFHIISPIRGQDPNTPPPIFNGSIFNEYFIDQCRNIPGTSYIDVLILDKIWYFSSRRDEINNNIILGRGHFYPYSNIPFSQQSKDIIRFLTLPPFVRKRRNAFSG